VADHPRAARWDTVAVLTELARATGIELADEGRCAAGQIGAGQIGAACVRWPDGHRSVLTCGPAGYQGGEAGSLTAVARSAGVPAPGYELVVRLAGLTAVVQELLPGAPPQVMTRHTVGSMLAVHERCRGLLAGRPDLPAPSLYLRADGPGFCRHAPMAAYSRRTARLLAVIEQAGRAVPERLPGDDLVHFDFHPENVLVDGEGSVTGVVDWDGAARSDGALDLMTLRFDLAHRAPELAGPVHDRLLAQAAAPVRLACWAHMSLRLVDWSIRELDAAAVCIWTAVAEELRETAC
jgi:aminoglycoside phosphotransferase (APT) family kinase protein